MGLGNWIRHNWEDALNVGTGLFPTIVGSVQSWRLRNDPVLNQGLNNRLSEYNNNMQGGGPFADPYGGYGQFGQFNNGQNLSAMQGSFFNTINMLNDPNNPANTYQRNLQSLGGMQAPTMYDTTAGLSNMMGRNSQFGSFNSPTGGFMPSSMPGGTYFGGGPNGTPQSTPGWGPLDSSPRPIDVWRENRQRGNNSQSGPGLPQPSSPRPPGVMGNSTAANAGMQVAGGPQTPQNSGMQINQPNTGNQSPYGQLMGNPTGGRGGVTQAMLNNPVMPTGPNTQNALNNPTGGTTSALGNIMQQGTAGTPQSVQNALGAPNAGQHQLNSVVNQSALQGLPSLTNQVAQNPQAATTGLLGTVNQMGQGGAGQLATQIAQNPMSLGQSTQDAIYQQGADQIARQTQDVQRQLAEQANASGRFQGGGLDKAMLDAQISGMGQRADLRRDIGIQAARTNFNDLLNANQAQQGDISRQFGQALGAGQFGQGINQNQFQNLLAGAGLQQQGVQNQFGNQLNAAQFGQNTLNSLWGQGQQNAQLGLQNQNQQFNQALGAGGFEQNILNNRFNQGQQTAGLEMGLQNQQFGQGMQSAGLEQQDLQRQFGNLLGTNQFQLGAEGQLANQQLAQNQQNLGAYQQNFQNQFGLANSMYGAGQAADQRNLGLWDRLTGAQSQGMDYNNQLMQQILAQRATQVAPMAIPSAPAFNQNVGGGGGGGGGNDWMTALAGLAGKFAGSYFG